MGPKLSCLLLAACAGSLSAQQPPELKEVMTRLDRLEAQNRDLMAEIRALRLELAAGKPAPEAALPTVTEPADAEAPPQPVADRVDIAERRVAELDQTKIGSEHRLPVTLTGMLLFNTFLNGKGSGGTDNPTLLHAIGVYLQSSLPTQDRRNPSVRDRRNDNRSGRRCWDPANLGTSPAA
jgi:hypothetical protein